MARPGEVEGDHLEEEDQEGHTAHEEEDIHKGMDTSRLAVGGLPVEVADILEEEEAQQAHTQVEGCQADPRRRSCLRSQGRRTWRCRRCRRFPICRLSRRLPR